MVCKEDWETRNIADFYDTKNDTHILPFTRPDNSDYSTWTPAFTTLNVNNTTQTQRFIRNNQTNIITFQVEWQFAANVPGSFTCITNTTMTLPVTSVIAGTAVIRDSNGVKISGLGMGIPASSTTLNFGAGAINFNTPSNYGPYNIILTGQYGV